VLSAITGVPSIKMHVSPVTLLIVTPVNKQIYALYVLISIVYKMDSACFVFLLAKHAIQIQPV
jgi:hypothetical protein